MSITRLNHVVLYVRDVEVSRAFYVDVLGFAEIAGSPGRASFLRASGSTNDHDLGLFAVGAGAGDSAAGSGTVGMYHVAWEVETLAELATLRQRLSERGSLVGATDHGTTMALYAKDPDGLEFEVSWLVPADQLDSDVDAQRATSRPLDLAAAISRYGAETRGGLGVSIPLGVRA
jgi:catechol-2,3-dioxygenase